MSQQVIFFFGHILRFYVFYDCIWPLELNVGFVLIWSTLNFFECFVLSIGRDISLLFSVLIPCKRFGSDHGFDRGGLPQEPYFQRVAFVDISTSFKQFPYTLSFRVNMIQRNVQL